MPAYYAAGRYKVRITGQALTENRGGNPELQLRILPVAQYVNGKESGISTDFERTIFLTFTDKTIGLSATEPGWVLVVLRTLGWKGTSFFEFADDHADKHSFVGLEVNALCQHKAGQRYENGQLVSTGDNVEKWSFTTKREPKPVTPAGKKTFKSLNTKFSKILKATANVDPATMPQPEGPSLQPAGAGEIPF